MKWQLLAVFDVDNPNLYYNNISAMSSGNILKYYKIKVQKISLIDLLVYSEFAPRCFMVVDKKFYNSWAQQWKFKTEQIKIFRIQTIDLR